MAKFNLFNYIINQIKENLKSETQNETFEVSKLSKPITVVNILVSEGAFKVDSINEKATVYEIKYKDLNLNASRLKHLLRWDKSINREKYNDIVRYDDYECHSYSKDVLTEWDGAFCPDNVEHIDPVDDSKFDLYAQYKGYTVEQMKSFIEANWLNRESIIAEYREFLEQCFAADYEIGEDVEELV